MRLLAKIALYAALVATLLALAHRFGAAYEHAVGASSGDATTRALTALGAYLLLGTALALLTAWDIAQLAGHQSERLLLGGGRVLAIDPRPRQAERLRAGGEPLEAIRLLRAYLQARPRDWQTAVRIAEIYEQDLRNPLAAALEYEDLLRHRLPRQARPWLTLRLANLHLKLRRADLAVPLLRQLDEQFGDTPAAAKARRRLAIYEETRRDARADGLILEPTPT